MREGCMDERDGEEVATAVCVRQRERERGYEETRGCLFGFGRVGRVNGCNSEQRRDNSCEERCLLAREICPCAGGGTCGRRERMVECVSQL